MCLLVLILYFLFIIASFFYVISIIFSYWGLLAVIILVIPLLYLSFILIFGVFGMLAGYAWSEGRKARQIEQRLQTFYGDPPYTAEQRKNVEQEINRAIESGELS